MSVTKTKKDEGFKFRSLQGIAIRRAQNGYIVHEDHGFHKAVRIANDERELVKTVKDLLDSFPDGKPIDVAAFASPAGDFPNKSLKLEDVLNRMVKEAGEFIGVDLTPFAGMATAFIQESFSEGIAALEALLAEAAAEAEDDKGAEQPAGGEATTE